MPSRLAPGRLLSLLCSAAVLALLVLAGCDCDTTPRRLACTNDMDCPQEPEEQYCYLGADENLRGECVPKFVECDAEPECCPGQACGHGLCTDAFVSCDGDETCTVRGQVCRVIGEFRRGEGCTFERCGSGGTCSEGLHCFNGYCVGEPPCNGGCQPGRVCTPVNNRCFEIEDDPERWPSSCQVTCSPGTVLVFNESENVFNRCDKHISMNDCRCEALPPIGSPDASRYSDLAATPDRLLVSAYDQKHGDLVLHTFAKDGLTRQGTEWIDGIPSGGPVVGDPEGPRFGRGDPGPDVGRYTSIAYDPNGAVTHIAYYAVRDGNTALGDLRYAVRSGNDAWRIHTVDGRNEAGGNSGDVGMYASLTLAPDGAPVIAYFQRGGAGETLSETAVKFARAKKRIPESASDWTVTTISSGERPPPPCGVDGCASNENCIDDGAGGVCVTRASGCRPSCSPEQACSVGEGGGSTCLPALRESGLVDLPRGSGLFPKVAYLDNVPVVVWYDRENGHLMGAIASSDSAAGTVFEPSSVTVLDSGTPLIAGVSRNVGLFPSLAVGPATVSKRLAVAYMDGTTRQLRVLVAGPNWSGREVFIADDGKNPAGSDDAVSFVGADTSIAFSGGKLWVAYQDSTGGNLKLAEQPEAGAQFITHVVDSEGAGGFYARLVADGAARFASHAVIKARTTNESANRLRVHRLP